MTQQQQPPRVSRRRFLGTVGRVAAGGGVALMGGGAYGALIEPEQIDVTSVTIPIAKLPPAADGLRIVQLSDLHLHPVTQIELIQRAVAAANALKPDLVALTGDFVQERADAIFELAPVLMQLNATHGVYAVLGNHDYWTSAAVVRQGFAQMRIPLLENSGLGIDFGAEQLYLAGLDDGWSGRPNLERGLANCPADVPAILLMHEPDFIDAYSQDPRVALQLSGHTHGGQVRVPGYGALVLPRYGRKYDMGLYRVNDTWLYTNRGIGVNRPALRINCKPEVTLLTLTRA